jgi:AcrR family transcriptional regulator
MTLDKRTRLLKAAVELSYERGFQNTSIADIAAAAKVPVGNVYYYFKTKEEIGAAIVSQRLEEFETLRVHWDRFASPKQRLIACIETTLANKDQLAQGGCPMGTLCSELQKVAGLLGAAASALLSKLLDWMEAQFRALGKKTQSRGLAIHLLAALQGAAVLAHGLHDPGVVVMETRRLHEWISGM